MQTNLTQIVKAYFGSATFFTIAGEGLMFIAQRRQWLEQPDYLLPLIASFAVPAFPFGVHLAARVVRLTAPPARPTPPGTYARAIPWRVQGQPGNLFLSAVAWIAGQPQAPPGTAWGFGEPGAKTIPYRPEPMPPEFIFWEAGMQSLITEVRLFQFCKVAWRRQQRAYFGDLSSNKILSREYFTRQARPRFPMADYRSIMHILTSRDLVLNRWAGKGGTLRYPPGITTEEAKRRWQPGGT